jgi:hypothetical protein
VKRTNLRQFERERDDRDDEIGHGHLRPLQPLLAVEFLVAIRRFSSRRFKSEVQHCDKPDSNGAESCSTGGMKAARAIWQNGVAVNMSRHQRRQRSIVQRSTRTTRASPPVRIR